MKTLTVILILLAFLQTSILPVNFGLILILVRAFIKQDRANFLLGLSFGLLLSHLMHLPLGLLSAVFVILVELVYLWSKTPIARNALTILPISVVALLIVEKLSGTTQIWPQIFWEIILILPIYLLVRFWEEQFTPPREIKLRV